VLIAMGLKHEIAQGSLLFSLGINNQSEDIDYILEVLPPIVDRLRQMSPLYAKYLKKDKGGS
jgi:cysteine desulfurase